MVFNPVDQLVNGMIKDNLLADNLSDDFRYKAVKFVLTFEKGKNSYLPETGSLQSND